MLVYGTDDSSNNGLIDWKLQAERGVRFNFYRKNLIYTQDRLWVPNTHRPQPARWLYPPGS